MNVNKTQRYQFYSALLKTIACTRNNASDDSNYQEGVLDPAQAIRKMETSSNTEHIIEAEAQQAFSLLNKIFTTKQTPNDERDHFLRYIEEVSGVSVSSLSEV